FDVVVVAAQKPHWFQEGRPLLEREGSVLRDVEGPLERGKIYEGGNLKDFEASLGVPGSGVLYVGDHIYGDILRSKKESAWRTAMIIQELDAELEAHDSCHAEMSRQRALEESRDNLEDELRYYQTRWKELGRKDADPEGAAERPKIKRAIE